MTAISGATLNFTFDKSMFSDPAMRPHLEAYYNETYDALRENIAARKEAQANGEFPETIKTKDGKTASPAHLLDLEKAIPRFDKWLDMQQNGASPFDFAKHAETGLMLSRVNDGQQNDFYNQQMENLNNFHAAMVEIMEEAQNAEGVQPDQEIAAASENLSAKDATSSPHLSFNEIATKYNVRNISPQEVDKLVKELQDNNLLSSKDALMLMTHGEDFLSHMPGEFYSQARLSEKIDLLDLSEYQRKITSGPKEQWDRQIALLKRLDEAAG